MRRASLNILLALACIGVFCMEAAGQQRVSVGFWNVENLFDTIPSRFYDDSGYTPQGRLKWNTEKYRTKLQNLARVIDDAGFDILGLAEVENEAAVRDLVAALSDDYNYIHRTSADYRGIDHALLYKGDKFFPERSALIRSGYTREFLHVRGELPGGTVGLLVCHLPSKQSSASLRREAMRRLAEVADSLMRHDAGAKLIVMGDFNCDPSEKLFRAVFGRRANNGLLRNAMLYAPLKSPADGGFGSYAWDGRWYLFDNILLSPRFVLGEGLRYRESGVFVREYMLAGDRAATAARRNWPNRTFSSGRHTAGFSDHLPVYVILEAAK